ncbi:glucose-1-phosphate thymidylyltransferase [bacterium]|nr:glucose-1-phosphate thymidylyltransferase [candidate division CSSED10-310 bacterium]
MMKREPIESVKKFLYPDQYFRLDETSVFKQLFLENEPVWTGLDRIESVINCHFKSLEVHAPLPVGFHIHARKNREGYQETIVSIEKGFYASEDVMFPEIGMSIGSGSSIEPGVVIKPPLMIGRNTEIRQGAYIRGGAIIGNHCTVGHTTEVKTAVFMDYTEAGHFAYVGDSILGRCVNLGAGTKLANLPFRTLIMKERQAFENFSLRISDIRLPIDRSKLGSILGDGVETGCNSTLAPGTLIGSDSWVYPCLFIRSGYYPPGSIIKSDCINQVHPAKRVP